MMLLGLNDPASVDFSTNIDLPDFSMPESAPASAPIPTSQPKMLGMVWAILSTASAALSGYHGYKRNNSIGWGIVWFGLGGLFPVITPTIAFAQGFGKRR